MCCVCEFAGRRFYVAPVSSIHNSFRPTHARAHLLALSSAEAPSVVLPRALLSHPLIPSTSNQAISPRNPSHKTHIMCAWHATVPPTRTSTSQRTSISNRYPCGAHSHIYTLCAQHNILCTQHKMCTTHAHSHI